jgi:hypothetical protein
MAQKEGNKNFRMCWCLSCWIFFSVDLQFKLYVSAGKTDNQNFLSSFLACTCKHNEGLRVRWKKEPCSFNLLMGQTGVCSTDKEVTICKGAYPGHLQVTQPVGYVGTLSSVQFEYIGEHGRVDHKGWQSGLQGTVHMSTCESTAEWTARDCRCEYMWEHGRVDPK